MVSAQPAQSKSSRSITAIVSDVQLPTPRQRQSSRLSRHLSTTENLKFLNMELKFRNLRANEIEIRRGRTLKDGRVELLCYKTYLTDCTILDETVGPENWVVNYRREGDTLLGGIAIYSPEHQAFLWKWAAGAPSDYEATKGEQSDALKRAGFVWNIGRTNLYSAPRILVTPESDYTTYYVKEVGFDDDGKMKDIIIVDNKRNIVFSYHDFKVDGTQSYTAQAPAKEYTKDVDGLKAFVNDRWDSADKDMKHLLSAFYNEASGTMRQGDLVKYGPARLFSFIERDIKEGKRHVVQVTPPGVDCKPMWVLRWKKK